ncbi:MAG: HlyC/CorC family transporter [Lachnospiraceae bacterium]|nr:HlyC/CorC family transporter [Lachnospiraceae bacterium]
MSTGLIITLVVFLICLSAFFSGSEIVYAAASKPRLHHEADEGSSRAKKALCIVEDYVRAIATILVGNNLVNIATASLVTLLCVSNLFPGNPKAELYAEIIATLALLIFGEILPKILCAEHANRLALTFARPLTGAMAFFKPVVRLVTRMVDALSRLWTPEEGEVSMTDEELAMVVDSIQEEGVFTESEGELIKSAIEFSEVTAHDILIPRVDVSAYDIEEPLEELLTNSDAMSYSRLPVYRESIDHIIGILPMKKFVKEVLTRGAENVSVEEMLVEPLFVHMTKNINEILKEFRAQKTNMAVVLDEYGGTMGILTIEDILEEIVGEIYDETDEPEEEDVTEVADGTYLLDGSMNIYDAFEEIDYEPKDFNSEYTTLSGWITELLDHFPEVGNEFTYEAISGKVLAVEGPLVSQVQIRVDKTEDED